MSPPPWLQQYPLTIGDDVYTVYLATNSKNGKRYVGVTGAGVGTRSQRHLALARCGKRQCPRLYDAIRKHGGESFQWAILAILDDKDAAYRHEMLMVSYLMPEYNVAPGGVAGPASFHQRKPVICLSDGRVFRSSLEAGAFYGAHPSNIAGACRGATSRSGGRFFQFFDAPMSDTERQFAISVLIKIGVDRRSRGGVYAGRDVRSLPGPAASSKPVVCLDDGRFFDSASAAARFYGSSSDVVSRACRGDRGARMVKGYRLAYAADIGQRMFA